MKTAKFAKGASIVGIGGLVASEASADPGVQAVGNIVGFGATGAAVGSMIMPGIGTAIVALIGGTAGKTTLSGEGLQHRDGHSHLMASAVPNLKAYDPAYSYEIATIIHYGLKDMYEWQNDVFYYLTLENENYIHPPMINEEIAENIIKGIYCIKERNIKSKTTVQLLASGSMVNEIIEAGKLLKNDWNIDSSIWSVTSYSELHKEAEDVRRWNILHPESKPRKSFLEKMIKTTNGPVIAVSDYVKLKKYLIAC